MGVYSFATDGAIKGLMKRLVAICAGLIGIAVLWFVPDAGHVDLHRAAREAYESRVLAFLGKM